MQDIQLTYNNLVIFFAVLNTLLGVLFGLFPLVVGFKNANRKYGIIGFIASVVGGFLLSIILAFPLALIFTLLSLRKAPAPGDSSELSPSA